MKIYCFLFSLGLVSAFLVEDVCADSSPIEIKAQGQIICDQKENFCTAEEKATATRDHLSIHADKLTVQFEPQNAQKKQTQRTPHLLKAQGHVQIFLPGREAIGDNASYNLKTGVFLLTGESQNPEIHTEEAFLTSPSAIRYCEKNGLGSTQDGLFVHHTKHCAIKAPFLHAFFSPSQNDTTSKPARALKKIVCEGGVWIVSPQYTLYADKARYEMEKDLIILKGNIKAADSSNILKGEYAILTLGAREHVTLLPYDPDIFPISSQHEHTASRVQALVIPRTLSHKPPSS